MNAKSGYQTIFKGTFLLGGVQFFQILVSLIRGKTTAQFIGAEGMGVSGLLTSSLAMVITIAGLGCTTSCVKYIASLNKEDDSYLNYVHISQSIFKFIALGGMLLTCLLAPLLSYISFSSNEYILSYLLLSFYVYFSLYSGGLSSIFQGLRELKCIAKGNVIVLLGGMVCSVVLYFLFGKRAIIPVILISPLISVIYFHFSLKKIFHRARVHQFSYEQRKSIFKEFVSLGLPLVVAALIGNLSTYTIDAFISSVGSLSDIGLYNAGMSITNRYIGLLFSAMATDYFPRLSAIAHNVEEVNETVNQQGEIIVLFAFPLLSIMILSAPVLIRLLLSSEFIEITFFVRIIGFGMFFQVISFCFGYVSFAKGDKKIYLFFEGIITNILKVILNCLGYYFWGLRGLACSFVLMYVIYYVVIFLVCKIRYRYIMSRSYFILTVISGIGVSIVFLLSFSSSLLSIVISILLTGVICVFSIIQLEKRIGLKEILIRRFKRQCKK